MNYSSSKAEALYHALVKITIVSIVYEPRKMLIIR